MDNVQEPEVPMNQSTEDRLQKLVYGSGKLVLLDKLLTRSLVFYFYIIYISFLYFIFIYFYFIYTGSKRPERGFLSSAKW